MQKDSERLGNIDEIQKLKDEIFHLQNVNSGLQKKITVEIKAEVGRALQEKEILEEKLKSVSEKLRNKSHELQMLIGQPRDPIGQREAERESMHNRILELENDLQEQEARANLL